MSVESVPDEEEEVKEIGSKKPTPKTGKASPAEQKKQYKNLKKNTPVKKQQAEEADIDEDLKEKLERILPVPVPKPAKELPLRDSTKLRKITNLAFCPEADAPYEKGQLMPLQFIADALVEIEQTQGKGSDMVKKDIISNVFRTAITQTPLELI
jgi:hypothetical protein